MSRLPLEGIRIIGATQVLAGPFGETILADWGAEVIRVESCRHFPPANRGLMARPPDSIVKLNNPVFSYVNSEAGERPWNRVSGFNALNRNKLGITLDITRPEGADIFKRLVKISDIVINNNSYGVLEKYGLGYEELKKVKPDIIEIACTGFGATGPYRDFLIMAFPLDMFIGHTMLRNYPDMDPRSASGVYLADAVAGATIAFAAMLALHYREKTGEGQYIDVSMAEATISHLADAIMEYTMNGRVPRSLGNRDRLAAPCGCYKCKGDDRWINISIFSEREWERFCQIVGKPEWCKHPKFSSFDSRWQNQDELDRLIEEWTSKREDYEIMHLLQANGIAAGVVIDEKDAYNDPHLRARGFFEEIYQADCGTHLYPGMIWKTENTPNRIRKAPIRLGEDNEYVYKQLLGVSEEEYARLIAEGHIGTEYVAEIP